MIVPDANLLLYAYDSDSRFHRASALWWQGCLSGSETVGLCTAVLFAFVRVGTSSRAFAEPLSIEEAAGHIRSWLERSITELLVAEEADTVQALAWLEAAGAGGNLTTDAQIAAIASRHRAVIHTTDLDFQRFKGVRSHNPLLGAE